MFRPGGSPARRVLLGLTAACVLVAAQFPGVQAQEKGAADSPLIGHFNRAIADAAVYRRAHLRRLRPLAFDPASGAARVVTLTAAPYTPGPQQLAREVWVTGVPEVREKARRFLGDPAMRLRQLLGLHPDSPVTHFVTLTVRRADVFRPAAEPDPTTSWPCADPDAPECGEAIPASAPEPHVRWMANQMLSAYLISRPLRTDGYPWTRLGYTYDWHPGADRYGASEYVVRSGARVTVEAVTPVRDYLSAANP